MVGGMIINGIEYTFIGSVVNINQPSPDTIQLFFKVGDGTQPNKMVTLSFEAATEFWANWTDDIKAYDALIKELNNE
jgi:hypothetical protein